MSKFTEYDPRLLELLTKHKEVFSELPPPSKGQILVQIDLKLKKEFEHSNIRSKCWPMPKVDQGEIETEANEMLRAGLAEEFSKKEFLRFCSPTLLVDKEKGVEQKASKSRRMCVDYRKLNQRPQVHAGSIAYLHYVLPLEWLSPPSCSCVCTF